MTNCEIKDVDRGHNFFPNINPDNEISQIVINLTHYVQYFDNFSTHLFRKRRPYGRHYKMICGQIEIR